MIWRAPTKKLIGAADFASTQPKSIAPLMNSTAPTNSNPTDPMSPDLSGHVPGTPAVTDGIGVPSARAGFHPLTLSRRRGGGGEGRACVHGPAPLRWW